MNTRATRDHGTAAPWNRATPAHTRLTAAAPLRPSIDDQLARAIENSDVPEAARRHAATIRVGLEERDRVAEGLDRMLAGAPGGFAGLHAFIAAVTDNRFDPFRAWSDLQRRGYAAGLTEAVHSGTWTVLLGDAMHRAIVAEYQTAPGWNAWRRVATTRFGVDFRTQRVLRIGGYGNLPAVLEGAPYQPLPTPGDELAGSYAATKRGGTEDLTFELIANDDVQALQRIVRTLGRSAAVTLSRFVFDAIATNPTMPGDGLALFSAGHANTTSSALSAASLAAGRKAMRVQAAAGDPADVLGIVPASLVVGPELEEVARELTAPTTPGRDLDVLIAPHLTGTAWYLIADPLSAPTVEVGFAAPNDEPTITIGLDETDFDADKVVIKVAHAYGASAVDHRGLFRGNA